MTVHEYIQTHLAEAGITLVNDAIRDGVYDVSGIPFFHIREDCRVESNAKEYIDDKVANARLKWPDRAEQFRRHYERQYLTPEQVNNFLAPIKAACQDNKVYLASAYQRSDYFVLAQKPKSFPGKINGGGFEGHGTAALLEATQPVTAILILGEDD